MLFRNNKRVDVREFDVTVDKLCRIFHVSAITCSLFNDCSENDAMHTASMA